MQKFNGYKQLIEIVKQIEGRSFDDTEVTFGSHFDNTLEIRFIVDGETTENRKVTDDDGKERLVYDRLLFQNVSSFDVEVPDDGSPHRIVDIERMDEKRLRFVLTHARWIVGLNGEIAGELSEQVDETDFKLEFSMTALIIFGVVAIAGIIGAIKFLF